MSLDDVVNITISRAAAAVSRQGFGTALILGTSASGWGSDRVRTYTKPSLMLDDGFTVSDLEYKQALALYSQTNKPAKFKVGRRLTPVAQVTTLTPNVTLQEVQDFTVTLNGVEFSFESDANPTAAEIVTGLIALINAGTEPVTASGTSTLILTADSAGISFNVETTSNLTEAATVANVGVSSDLADISAIDNDWYALCLSSRDNSLIMEAAGWIESNIKFFVACSADSAVIAAGSSDIASRLKAKNYARTAYIYSADEENGADGALLGNIVTRAVGSYTAKFKSLNGITVDNLTPTQVAVAKTKNATLYTVIGGAPVISEGVVCSGEFIDVVIGIDWIHVNLQADIFQVLRDNDKIPYTNAGTTIIVSTIDNRLRLATVAQILTAGPAYVVNAPLITDQDPADKAARRLGGITFTAYLAGAVHATTIQGEVLVA